MRTSVTLPTTLILPKLADTPTHPIFRHQAATSTSVGSDLSRCRISAGSSNTHAQTLKAVAQSFIVLLIALLTWRPFLKSSKRIPYLETFDYNLSSQSTPQHEERNR